jgi:hypothetical protein
MAYLGNKNGPRESEIIDKLGPSYFGCSGAALEEDIAYHIDAEQREEVAKVHVDDSSHPYVLFSSAKAEGTQRFYLEEHGLRLEGDIKTFTEEEQGYWRNREASKAD